MLRITILISKGSTTLAGKGEGKMAIPVERITYRDRYNAICGKKCLRIEGRLYDIPNRVGDVWAPRQWVNSDIGAVLSRGDMVFRLNGVVYRLGSRLAKPLVLKKGEVVMSVAGNAAFIHNPTNA